MFRWFEEARRKTISKARKEMGILHLKWAIEEQKAEQVKVQEEKGEEQARSGVLRED